MITVPDHASHHHRLLLLQAAQIAELNVVQLVNQSTAAAAWYWTATRQVGEHNALFVSFGASSISATVMVKSFDHICPVSAAGTSTLGGEELTQQLMRYFLEQIDEKYIDNTYIHRIHRRPVPQLARGSQHLLHSTLSRARVVQWTLIRPRASLMLYSVASESAHRVGGRPRGRFLSLRYHPTVAVLHLPSHLLTTWPAQRCFIFVTCR
uniref:Uncharacterized protein n=1 Tax=Plectus sambesii TaxID=2011161 RepID=A0A914WCU4_9BILA